MLTGTSFVLFALNSKLHGANMFTSTSEIVRKNKHVKLVAETRKQIRGECTETLKITTN